MALPLVKQIGRVGKEYILELSREQEALATDVHEKSIVFDLHMHGVVLAENESDYDEWLASQRFPFAYEGLKHAGVTAFIDGFAYMVNTWRCQEGLGRYYRKDLGRETTKITACTEKGRIR